MDTFHVSINILLHHNEVQHLHYLFLALLEVLPHICLDQRFHFAQQDLEDLAGLGFLLLLSLHFFRTSFWQASFQPEMRKS